MRRYSHRFADDDSHIPLVMIHTFHVDDHTHIPVVMIQTSRVDDDTHIARSSRLCTLHSATYCVISETSATQCDTLQHTQGTIPWGLCDGNWICFKSQPYSHFRNVSVSMLQCVAMSCSVLQCVAVSSYKCMWRIVIAETFLNATHRNTIHHNATHCNTLQILDVYNLNLFQWSVVYLCQIVNWLKEPCKRIPPPPRP